MHCYCHEILRKELNKTSVHCNWAVLRSITLQPIWQESRVCFCHLSDLWPLWQIRGHMPVNYAASRKMKDDWWWDWISSPRTVVVSRVISNKTNDVKFVRKQLTHGATLSFRPCFGYRTLAINSRNCAEKRVVSELTDRLLHITSHFIQEISI